MNYDDIVKVKINYDDGTSQDTTMSEAIKAGATTENLTQNKAKFYKNGDKYSATELGAEGTSFISLDKKTGKFTIHAPTTAIKNETFKSQISDTVKSLSAAYKSNPDYKFSITGEDGTTKEKSIQDIINDLNAPAKNSDGSLNPNSLQYMASAAIGMERTKEGHKKNIELSDDDAIRINTVAVGPDLKDNTLQLISNLPEAQFLRDLSSYDANTGMAQYKDIMDNAWNKEKVSSEDMIKLMAALENYFKKGDYSNKEDYIRNTATARFLFSTQPEMSWARDVAENIVGLIDGVLGFATDAGTANYVASDYVGYLLQGMGPDQWDEYLDLYGEDYSGTTIRRGGYEGATDTPWEKVDGKIGKLTFNEYGAPEYKEERIDGAFENPRTHAQYIRTVFKENQAIIKKDIEYLHSSQASWDTVGYVITNIATIIGMGNAMSDAFVSAGSSVVAGVTRSVAVPLEELTSFAGNMYSSGTALAAWDTAEGIAALVNGMRTIYDVAVITGEAAAWVNTIGEMLASSAALTPILGLVGESLGEAIVGSPDIFVEFLKSTEINDDTKNYLIETYVGNALGWGIGLTAGRFLMKVGNTTRGRAISFNLSKKIFKVQNAVGDSFDNVVLKLRRVKGDDIADKIETLRNKGGRASKQANALASARLLREARKAIYESDSIKILGKDTDEIEKALVEAESKINDLRTMENALTSMQRRGMDIASAWLKDDGSGLKIATENFYKTAGDVADLEKSAGSAFKKVSGAVTDMTNGKTIHLFSQTTTNYIKATEKLDYINSYIKYYEKAEDVTQDILKKIDAYKEEAEDLKSMIDAFTSQATPQLRAAADKFIDADRKWWSSFEDLRSDIGLTDSHELEWFRKSGFWGKDGAYYAQTGRKADLSEYVVRHRDGSSNVKTFDSYEQYMAGATGDFADPMAQMQVALYDSANKQAYRSFAKSFDALTGSMTTKVSGEETALYQRMKKGLQSAYVKSSEEMISSMSEGVGASGVSDVLSKLKLKKRLEGDMRKANAAKEYSEIGTYIELDDVTAENAGTYVRCLDAEDTSELWDQFYDVSVREFLRDGGDNVPPSVKRKILNKARELGLSPAYDEVVEEGITVRPKYDLKGISDATKAPKIEEATFKANNAKMKDLWEKRNIRDFEKYPKTKEGLAAWYKDNPLAKEYNDFRKAKGSELEKFQAKYSKELVDGAEDFLDDNYQVRKTSSMKEVRTWADQPTVEEAYDAVNRALSGVASNPDEAFENEIKREILAKNKNVTEDTRVQKYLTEQRQIAYNAKMETTLSERTYRYQQLADEYELTVSELDTASRDVVEYYVSSMTREGSMQRAAIDELCRFYGLEGDPIAVRYFALCAFTDNKAKYKAILGKQIKSFTDKNFSELTIKERNKVVGILTNGIVDGLEEEMHDAYLIVKDINPNAVHEETEKLMDEVKDIAKKIEDVKGDQYAGNKNIVALRNAQGQVEYYETDPLLAGLVNFQSSAQHISGFGQAIYNANYLWTKLFRLGTTAINIKSMISQSFRDPINMFIGGGAYRTSQQVADNLTDVFGDDIIDYLKRFEPDALKALQETSEETGESVARLAVKRELNIGKALSPAATETNMYRSLRNARVARLNGVEDVYDVTTMDRTTKALDNVAEKGGKLNEVREKALRNVAYANGLETAIKRGYSLDQARTYATFIMNESTTNFSRLTNHLLALRDTVPYLGSAINGSKSFWRLLSMDPVGVVGRLTGGIIIPQIAMTAYSLQDERNREIYKNISEYQKEDNLIFVANGHVFSIPIPQELGAFVNPFRQMVESMYNVSTNTAMELTMNDILGFSPIDLSGFTDLDYAKIESSSPGFMERVGKGVTKMWAQLAPPPLKSGVEMITGVDPYTGRKIDTSYTDLDEDGNFIVKDYKSGLLAKAMNDMFKSWGLSSSAPVVQNILGNIFGTASVDVADFVVSLCSAVPNGGIDWSMDTNALKANEAYNPFYTLSQRIAAPIEVEVYDEAQTAWKTAVSQLYDMKAQLLESDEWKDYLKAKSQESDADKLKKLNSTKKNLVEDYFNKVKTIVENLQNNYGAQFTPAKYMSVLSLMTMEEQTLDSGSYGNYLNAELYKTARAQAIQTMQSLGFQSASGQDILGKYVTDKDGNIKVETYHPLALLQLDDAKGSSLKTQSNKQHYAVVRNLISEAGLFDQRTNYQKQISAAKKAKKYTEAEKLTNEYNEKVIRAVGSYIKQYTPEAVLSSDALDYLKDYIIVPSSFQVTKKGRYASSLGNGAYLSEAFEEPYLKYIFNYGGNRL